MKVPAVKLKAENYHAYVEGREVSCENSKTDLHTGDHVMVYKDTLAATSSLSVPNSTQQSQAIGVEGIVTSEDSSRGIRIRKL